MYHTAKINKRTAILLIIAAAAVIVLLILDFSDVGSASTAALSASVSVSAGDDSKRVQFLAQYGWQIEPEAIEVADVTIPAEFDPVYETYNELQLVQGFDLRPYCGRTVQRWSYLVTNYPDGIEGVHANLLVCEGKVIGGDICTLALNGFMHGFRLTGTGIMRETLAYDPFSV